MIRLTVLYNLAEGADEEEFLRWRLGEHQEANRSIPGVVRTDFARIDQGWPEGTKPPYRFMTTADWPDWESFRVGFYDPQVQADLEENVKKIRDTVFLVSEIVVDEKAVSRG